jgi:hypothetical protein
VAKEAESFIMAKKIKDTSLQNLPACAADFIKLVIKKIRYRKEVRADVQAELTAHFEDELHNCKSDEEKEQKAQQLIADFGDVKMLAVLMRRAKKRCRPLWRKALVRSLQATGLIFLYLLLCVSPLIVGRPTISVDYVERLNELVRADRNEADNARPYYEKAADLCVKMPQWFTEHWPTDFNDAQLHSLNLWLQDNQKALEILRKAPEQPYFWNDYQKSDQTTDDLTTILMPNVMNRSATYRTLAFAMAWQIRYEAYKGNIDSAVKDCIVLQKFGKHLQGKGLLVEQLVGIAIEALSHDAILSVLDKTDVPAETLKIIQDELAKHFEKRGPVINLEAEKVFWYDQIQRTFTDNGRGDGRVLLRGLPYALKSSKDMLRFLRFSYPSRKEIVANINGYFEEFDEFFEKTPSDLKRLGIYENKIAELEQTGLLMLGTLGHAFIRVSQITWRLETHRRGVLTIVAVMRYRKALGWYPENLEELVLTGYLNNLPIDPYSTNPLVYKKVDDDFLLYSVGSNFQDDGGVLGCDSKGNPINWAGNGDWVFWPVLKPNEKQCCSPQ